MNIQFHTTDYESETDCAAIAAWRNHAELRRLWLPERPEREIVLVTAADVRAEGAKKNSGALAADELATLNGKIIGQLTILVNPPMKRSSHAKVAWPSVIVGEDSLRGSGIVRRFGPRLLALARALDCSHFEAGVFEFNTTMRRLLEGVGFREFARVENVTRHEGAGCAALHYERETSRPFLRS